MTCISPQFTLLYTFIFLLLNSEFWQEAYNDLFADDILVEFPYAPPGMLQHMIPFEFAAYRYWLRQTVKTHKLTCPATVIPTTDPNLL